MVEVARASALLRYGEFVRFFGRQSRSQPVSSADRRPCSIVGGLE
jgi:hypothetical protein